jgi:transposase InsO family protein
MALPTLTPWTVMPRPGAAPPSQPRTTAIAPPSRILDIYSRYAVGWMVATRESAVLAEKLIAATCAKQGITRGQLSLHADRGSSMTSKHVALLLADLGVTQSHSRRTSPTTTCTPRHSSRP